MPGEHPEHWLMEANWGNGRNPAPFFTPIKEALEERYPFALELGPQMGKLFTRLKFCECLDSGWPDTIDVLKYWDLVS